MTDQPNYNQPNYNQPGAAGPQQPYQPGTNHWMPRTSFILGIASIVLFWVPVLNFILFAAEVLGVVFGAIALKRRYTPRWMAIWGIVLSIVGFLIFVVSIIISAALIANNPDLVNQMK